jgi:hypothetical protein
MAAQRTEHPSTLLTTRTYGLETEYSLYDDAIQAGDDFNRATHELLAVREGKRRSEFLENGGRLYEDLSHPEYATPECRDPWEVALYHHAGDLLLNRLRQKLGELSNRWLSIRRDNMDWGGRSYGCHENYLVPRQITGEVLQAHFEPFLISGTPLFGAGCLNQDGCYRYSVRAAIIDREIVWEKDGFSIRGHRSILNMRDESHLFDTDNDRYYRLHVTCRDTNVSELATFFKVASTSLMLAMIEAGESFSHLVPDAPVPAMKLLNRTVGQPARVLTASGLLTAYDIQRRILEVAERFVNRQREWAYLPEWVGQTLALWGQALDDLSRCELDDRPASSCWIDWWVKYHLMKIFREEDPLASPAHLFSLLMEYHQTNPEQGLVENLVQEGWLRRCFAADELARALREPSSHPRARHRAALIRRTPPDLRVKVDWRGLYLESGALVPFAFH